MKQRRKNLLKYAKKIDCDTLVTFEPENLFYMTKVSQSIFLAYIVIL